MLGQNLLVRSDVIADEGCTLTMDPEGTDHVRIAFGDQRDPFELVVHHKVLATIIQLGTQTLQHIDTNGSDD